MILYHTQNCVSAAVLPWKCLVFSSDNLGFFAGEGQNFLNLSVKVVMIGIWKTTEKYFGKRCFFLLSGYLKVQTFFF